MKRTLLYFVLIVLLLPSCSNRSGYKATVVKPKYHHRWFDRKKDKKTKRTKTVRMKS